MTPCNVQKCPNAADETVEPLLIVGPLCDEHRTRLLAGEDYQVQGTETTAIGTTPPNVLMGDSLLELDQYVLLEPPTKLVTADSPGSLIPLQVTRRGEQNEREINLVIPREMLPAVAAFFKHFGESDEE